ncbi:MAG: PepSY domain-containing protein [Clostridia bacterium]|nr:PepSY domain-containing protein [Clostridia bacterium]
MKKSIKGFLLFALVTGLMFFAAGCDEGMIGQSPSPSHSPQTTQNTTPDTATTPDTSPSASPMGTMDGGTSSASPDPSGSPGGISGFIEGSIVDPEDVPELLAAIEEEYPGATIESITHVTYEGEQAYKVSIKLSDGENSEVYVRSNYEIISGNAPSASPESTGNN